MTALASSPLNDMVQQLYIVIYDRPADLGGLSFWSHSLEQDPWSSMMTIADEMSHSLEPPALDLSSSLDTVTNITNNAPVLITANAMTNTTVNTIVNTIYQNVLHRAPDAAGLAFYSNLLETGQISPQHLGIMVMEGAQNEDVATVQNELSAANQFTAQATSYSGDAAAAVGRTFLSQVSGDSTAQASLLAQLPSYVNAASAATTNPAQFAGEISGGVLTSTAIVDAYASGTTPNSSAAGSAAGTGSAAGAASAAGNYTAVAAYSTAVQDVNNMNGVELVGVSATTGTSAAAGGGIHIG